MMHIEKNPAPTAIGTGARETKSTSVYRIKSILSSIGEVIALIYLATELLTLYTFMACCELALPFPDWFPAGLAISAAVPAAAILYALARIMWAIRPRKKYGVISPATLCRILGGGNQ